jgi:hypothetical protein
MNLDGFKSGPATDAVRFESEPPGAEVRVADQTCRTPCSLAVPTTGPQTAVFALNGYQTESEQLEIVTGVGAPSFNPNPVTVELTPAPPSARKPAPVARKKPAPKPRVSAAPATSTASTPAAADQTTPWPTAPAPRQ